jgi:3-hydroxyisobutyrate dehydrogenase-like beta-hydroxyacid dehydrogenase
MEIGFIGLGSMGLAIASNLRKAGHNLIVYNRSREKAEAFAKKGGRVAESPERAVQADVVFSMLADDHAVESVFLTPYASARKSESKVEIGDAHESKNLIDNQAPHTVHVSLSTISVALAQRLDENYRRQGKHFVSATVMGRPDVATKGELIVMAAGSGENLDKCAPLFEAIGKVTHVMGREPHQSNVAKVAANFMISSMLQTFGEAFALVRKNGGDEKLFYQIMAKDFFASPVMAKYGQLIVDRNYSSGAFTVKLQEKDTRLALECAQASQVPMAFASAIEYSFLSAIGRGMGDDDPCVIAKLIAENAGLKD